MWFKNLALFEFLEPFDLATETIEKNLMEHQFKPCSTSSPSSMGWVSPISQEAAIVHESNGFIMLAFQIQEKIVPAGVIKKILDEKVEEIELRESRKVKKKEKDTLKEEIYQSLLPRAFTRNTVIYAYIDKVKGWLVVNASSAKKAELLMVSLRKALGSLKVRIPDVMPVSLLLTQWLKTNEYPQDLTIEDQCVLQDTNDGGGVIRCQRQNLFTDDILTLIASGREVTQLALSWQDELSFVLNDEFMIKSVKFLEVVQDKANDIFSEPESQRFDADFVIMTETLRQFIDFMMSIFAKQVAADGESDHESKLDQATDISEPQDSGVKNQSNDEVSTVEE